MLVILGWILRVLVGLFLVRMVLAAIMGRGSAPRSGGRFGRRPPPRPAERLGGTLVRCRQCGTHVPQASAVKAGSDVFCSTSCRDSFGASARRAG
ncbi:MAG: PP0621 family protein [Vicinamibacterales bacterium]